jgi:transcriptional regulator with XRE-family HTH domain
MSLPSKQRKLIGNSIRVYRKKAGITQEELAEKADLHPVYVSEVERGQETVSVHALVRIAKALGVRMRDLVEEI